MLIPAMLATLALLGALSASDTVPAEPCASDARKPSASPQAFAVTRAGQPRDTLVSVAVCVLLPKSSTARIGSYHGELFFDSTSARVSRVERPSGDGMRVENTKLAGRVNFAGAAPAGFAAGTLLSVVLRVRPGAALRVRLRMVELNATDGTSLVKDLVTHPSS